jgi:hypothetical protein
VKSRSQKRLAHKKVLLDRPLLLGNVVLVLQEVICVVVGLSPREAFLGYLM